MKTEFILAFHKDAFKNVTVVDGFSTFPEAALAELDQYLVLRQRQYLDHVPNYSELGAEIHEGDQNYRQVLPYVVLAQRTADGIVVATYRRTKKVGETRLAGNVSIGYGGHVDFADVIASQSIPMFGLTVRQNIERELAEEVMLTVDGIEVSPCLHQTQYLGLILDDSDDVGKLHMGMLLVVWIEPGITVTARISDGLADMKSQPLAALLESDLPFENWTRIALQQLSKL